MQHTSWSTETCYDLLKKDEINLDTKFPYTHEIKTNNKSKKLSLGRIWFNTLLPDDFPLYNEPIDKKKVDKIIQQIGDNYEPEVASNYVRNIQKNANRMATIEPRSFEINMFTPSNEWKKKKEEFKNNVKDMSLDEYKQERQKLIDQLYKELEDKDISFTEALEAKSGGKMNKDVLSLLMVSKGITPDIEGNVFMIPEGISDGYNIENYYKAASEARNGFYVKTTAVRDPGYLSRKATMANANIKLSEKDCKTKKYLELYIDNNRASKVVGRYMKDEQSNNLVLIESEEQVINKKIKIRSPLYCKNKEGLCPICYGKLAEKLETKNIGIVAAGALNNESVNAMMKMRHSAEKTQIITVNFPEIIKKSTIKLSELNHILDIQEQEIYAKDDLIIELDRHEYDDKTLQEYHDYYDLPGLITIRYGEDNPVFYSLPLNFNINLTKPENLKEMGRFLILNYTKGDLVIYKKNYSKTINPAVITKILDGVTKYIKDPRIMLDMLVDELPGMDSVHLELMISNMFRDSTDNKIPARLNNYKNFEIIGCKKLPFVDSWLSALAFQDIGKAVETGLVNNEHAQFNDIEKTLVKSAYHQKE